MNQKEKYSNLSDLELLELFKRTGNSEFLGALYNRYIHLIYGVCMKFLKEREASQDAVMDIFEALMKKIEGQEILDFGKWVYVVAKNHCLMKLRKKEILVNSKEVGHIIMESVHFMHPNDEPGIRESQIKEMEEAINSLPEEQKECVKMFYYDEKSYAEIASETGYELKKVKSYIQNGKRNLKIWMEEKGERE